MANNGYCKTEPKAWTAEQTKTLLRLRAEGKTAKEIAPIMGRSLVSVSTKLKRLTKKDRIYNTGHVADKYEANMDFFNEVRPETVLDVFAGPESWYEANTTAEVVTNDKETTFTTHYHEDAARLMGKLFYENQKFDLIDLDPFGSTYDCFDMVVKMARKALVITFGEMGHKRFKRLDFVRRYYGIERLEDFTTERLVKEVQKIGIRNKKNLFQ